LSFRLHLLLSGVQANLIMADASNKRGACETVYCIIPTHNRIKHLTQCLNQLARQDYPSIVTIVINDGSTDGTKEHLDSADSKNLKVISGDGSMWWGAAVAAGMKLALSTAKNSDFMLLINDDSIFDQSYIANMVTASQSSGNYAMVSPQYDTSENMPFYVGYRIDYYRQKIEQVAEEPIDASVGRGLLVPVRMARNIGIIDAYRFQHYMGDLEYTARIKDYGYGLSVAWDAPMYSDHTPSDHHVQTMGELAQRLHNRSKTNIILILKFFYTRGPIWTRITALPRMLFHLCVLTINRIHRNSFKG